MAHCQTVDLYAVLGISVSAGDAEIRSAYRRASLRAHPDKGGSVDQFHKVTFAFEVISDPAARDLYNQRRRCSVPHRNVCSDVQGKKRRPPANASVFRPSKHLRSRTAPKQKMRRGEQTLQRLAAALQSVDAPQRRLVLASLGQHAQQALLSFMKGAASEARSSPADRHKTPRMKSQIYSFAASVGVRTIRHAQWTKYQASLQIRDLRLYTPEQLDLQAAIDDQIILVRIRNAMAAATLSDHHFWDDAFKQQVVYQRVLSENNTTDAKLGLRAWVQMRCNRWLGQRCKVGSPVSSFDKALQVHARLHLADMTSWHTFRAEWVQLMLLRGKRSRAEAEAFVDTRRQSAVSVLLAQAVRAVERVFTTSGTYASAEHPRRKKAADTHATRVSMKMMGA